MLANIWARQNERTEELRREGRKKVKTRRKGKIGKEEEEK